MDFRPVEGGEECSDSEGSHNEEAKEPDKTTKKEGEKSERIGVGKVQFCHLLFICHIRNFLNC